MSKHETTGPIIIPHQVSSQEIKSIYTAIYQITFPNPIVYVWI